MFWCVVQKGDQLEVRIAEIANRLHHNPALQLVSEVRGLGRQARSPLTNLKHLWPQGMAPDEGLQQLLQHGLDSAQGAEFEPGRFVALRIGSNNYTIRQTNEGVDAVASIPLPATFDALIEELLRVDAARSSSAQPTDFHVIVSKWVFLGSNAYAKVQQPAHC